MIKTSFTVSYRLNRMSHTVLGVTSIVPNLNGFLFFTEDGENHFIESHDMRTNYLSMYMEYSTDEDIQDEIELASAEPDKYRVYDHRKK